MEFTVTKEQILEFANWGNPDNKKKLKEWFPKAFESQLEVGKWYKNGDFGFERSLACVSHINPNEKDEFGGYGFDIHGCWFNNKDVTTFGSHNWLSATHEEIASALIAEAKKKGYKTGVRIKGLGNGEICTLPNGEFEYIKNANALWFGNPNDAFEGFDVFLDGIWAEILPEQKTIITHEKALKIIAKKLKVSPESIEIQ